MPISRRTMRSAIARCSPAGRVSNSTSSGSSRWAAPARMPSANRFTSSGAVPYM